MPKSKAGPTIKQVGGKPAKGKPPTNTRRKHGRPEQTIDIRGVVPTHKPFTGESIINGR